MFSGMGSDELGSPRASQEPAGPWPLGLPRQALVQVTHRRMQLPYSVRQGGPKAAAQQAVRHKQSEQAAGKHAARGQRAARPPPLQPLQRAGRASTQKPSRVGRSGLRLRERRRSRGESFGERPRLALRLLRPSNPHPYSTTQALVFPFLLGSGLTSRRPNIHCRARGGSPTHRGGGSVRHGARGAGRRSKRSAGGEAPVRAPRVRVGRRAGLAGEHGGAAARQRPGGAGAEATAEWRWGEGGRGGRELPAAPEGGRAGRAPPPPVTGLRLPSPPPGVTPVLLS